MGAVDRSRDGDGGERTVIIDLEAAEVRPERWDRGGLRGFFEAHGMSWAARDLAGP